MWIHGLPKGLEVLAKGLEYALLTTERAAKTCHDTGSGKQRLEKQSFTCFLVLPDEFIDNQIDNVAITKNCQTVSRAARDPIHPYHRWSGALQFCDNVLKHLLGWSSLAKKPTIEYTI